jgi:hypothetical protein
MIPAIPKDISTQSSDAFDGDVSGGLTGLAFFRATLFATVRLGPALMTAAPSRIHPLRIRSCKPPTAIVGSRCHNQCDRRGAWAVPCGTGADNRLLFGIESARTRGAATTRWFCQQITRVCATDATSYFSLEDGPRLPTSPSDRLSEHRERNFVLG